MTRYRTSAAENRILGMGKTWRVLSNGEVLERATNKTAGFIVEPGYIDEALDLRGKELDAFVKEYLDRFNTTYE